VKIMKTSMFLVYVSFASFGLGGSVARSQRSEPLEDHPTLPAEIKNAAWLHEVYLREASEYEFYQ